MPISFTDSLMRRVPSMIWLTMPSRRLWQFCSFFIRDASLSDTRLTFLVNHECQLVYTKEKKISDFLHSTFPWIKIYSDSNTNICKTISNIDKFWGRKWRQNYAINTAIFREYIYVYPLFMTSESFVSLCILHYITLWTRVYLNNRCALIDQCYLD